MTELRLRFHDLLLRGIGLYFFFKSGHLLFTEYAVLQAINLELNDVRRKYNDKLVEDFEKTVGN